MTVPEIRARYVDRADTIFQLAPPEPAQVSLVVQVWNLVDRHACLSLIPSGWPRLSAHR